MKKLTIFFISIFSISMMLTSAHSKILNTEIKSKGLKEFKVIHVGDLKLDKKQWTGLGYKSEQEWITDIKEIEGVFKKYLKKYAKGRTLTFAIDSKKIPKDCELKISFSKTKIDRGYGFGVGPWGSITTEMTIENIKSKKVLYKTFIQGKGTNAFGFLNQMKRADKKLAKDISKVLKK